MVYHLNQEVQVFWYIYTHLEILAVALSPEGLPTIKGIMSLKGESTENHAFKDRVIAGVVKGMAFDQLLDLASILQACERDGYRLKVHCGNITLYTDTLMRIDAIESFDVAPMSFASINSLPPSSSLVPTTPPPSARRGNPSDASPPTRREGASGNPPPLPSRRGKVDPQ